MPIATPSCAVVTRAVDLLAAAGIRVHALPNVTYYVVVPFVRGEDGTLTPGEAKDAPHGELARRRAQVVATAPGNVGAVAFSRTGDPDSGDFAEGVVLASFGEVDLDALQG